MRKYLFLLLLLLAARFCGAEPETNLISRLEPVPPFPEVWKAARAAHIPLEGMTSANDTGALSPGNSITALITLHQKGNRRTQWLVFLKSWRAPTAQSRKSRWCCTIPWAIILNLRARP